MPDPKSAFVRKFLDTALFYFIATINDYFVLIFVQAKKDLILFLGEDQTWPSQFLFVQTTKTTHPTQP